MSPTRPAHNYQSPDASTVDTLTSRYEWGVDTLGATTIYPATTDDGRHTTGASEFTLAIDPDNFGLLLRRKIDQSFPDQRATVEIAGRRLAARSRRRACGSLRARTRVVYSNPPGELDAPLISLETSNRQWREDEFLVPQSLTRGRSAVRVRLTFTPLPSRCSLTPALHRRPGASSATGPTPGSCRRFHS